MIFLSAKLKFKQLNTARDNLILQKNVASPAFVRLGKLQETPTHKAKLAKFVIEGRL